jgi:alkylation response protein AidB-like acyl-CoA dehydrogenase
MIETEDELHGMLLQSAADFLARCHSSQRVRELRTSETPIDRAMWRRIAEMGWLGMRLPEEMGGSDLPVTHAAELAVLFGSALLPEPFVLSAVLPAALLRAMPASALRDDAATHFANGSRVFAAAWQEKPGQLDAAWDTSVHQHSGGALLTGEKIFVSSGADTLLVAARAGDTPAVLLVEANSPGIARTTQKMSDGSSVDAVRFRDTPVDPASIVLRGNSAEIAVQAALEEARVVLAAQLSGMAQGALDLARTHIQGRVQFGQPIASFQAVRHRFVDLDLQRRLAFASWRAAARAFDGPNRIANVSAAKARCSEAAILISRVAVQMHGAMGYTDEADVGLYLRAAMSASCMLGNADSHRRRFAESTFLRKVAA